MTCPHSFPSCRGEKHPDHNSGRDLAPDKRVCDTSSQGGETHTRIIGLVVGVVVMKQYIDWDTFRAVSESK